jgi:DNA-binding transcriptional regulator LsrR (DeoR family)
VDSQEDKTSLVKDSYVQEVLAASRKANKAVFSLGNPAFSESSIHRAGYFSDRDLMDIKEGGAICDIISIAFLNSQGELILKNLTDRSIGITEQDLKAIPEKICLAGGTDKHESIKVAVQAGFVDTLITDHETAEYLMQ